MKWTRAQNGEWQCEAPNGFYEAFETGFGCEAEWCNHEHSGWALMHNGWRLGTLYRTLKDAKETAKEHSNA